MKECHILPSQQCNSAVIPLIWTQLSHICDVSILLEGEAKRTEEDFEAVVVAIGNYHEPNLVSRLTCKQVRASGDHSDNTCALRKRVTVRAPMQPDVAGMDAFPGLQMHCHNFRHNEPFRDQRVLVVGASYSGAPLHHVMHHYVQELGVQAREECLNVTDLERGEGCAKSRACESSCRLKGVRSPQDASQLQALSWPTMSLMWLSGSSTARAPGAAIMILSRQSQPWSACPC